MSIINQFMSKEQYLIIDNFINDMLIKVPPDFKGYYFIYFEDFKIRVSKGRQSLFFYENEHKIFKIWATHYLEQYMIGANDISIIDEYYDHINLKKNLVLKLLSIIDIYNLKDILKPQTEKRKVHKL